MCDEMEIAVLAGEGREAEMRESGWGAGKRVRTSKAGYVGRPLRQFQSRRDHVSTGRTGM